MDSIDKSGQRAPGVSTGGSGRIHYLVGGGFALILTLASFAAASSSYIYAPSLPVLLGVLAIAQMGVHLVFFLHVSTGADNTNNVLALAFGIIVVGLLVFGSMIIIADLNHNMMPVNGIMRMQP